MKSKLEILADLISSLEQNFADSYKTYNKLSPKARKELNTFCLTRSPKENYNILMSGVPNIDAGADAAEKYLIEYNILMTMICMGVYFSPNGKHIFSGHVFKKPPAELAHEFKSPNTNWN